MKIIEEESIDPLSNEKYALSIGNFDGVHLGHQALIQKLKSYGKAAILTFRNHPSEFLYHKQTPFITTLDHKLQLLEKAGIDIVLLYTFDEPFSKLSPEELILKINSILPFSHLILGEGAIIGHKREGTKERLKELATKYHFTLEYLPTIEIENQTLSSTLIRKAIAQNDLAKAKRSLGRSYSILARVIPGDNKGRLLGFPTANLDIGGLILPSPGVWAVNVNIKGHLYRAVANLGFAPTLHDHRRLLLEVHLIDTSPSLYNQLIEVFFLHFLRKEERFPTLDALRHQISQDIAQTKLISF